MKTRGLLLLSWAGWLSCQAQTSGAALPDAALTARVAKNYQLAGALDEQAMQQHRAQVTAREHFMAARDWARAGKATQAFRHLHQALQVGWSDVGQLRREEALADLQTDRRWPHLMRQAKAAVAQAEARQNRPLRRELEAILEADQAPRQAIGPLQQRYGLKSTHLDSLYERMDHQDAQNLARVQAIIAQYGWPGKQLVGRTGSTAAFLVLQHADLATIQQYLPLIRQETAAGGLEPQALALMEDRVLVYQNKPQLYGSQVHTNAVTGKQELYPIADEAHVDERRAGLGMEPLTFYAKLFGIEYTPVK